MLLSLCPAVDDNSSDAVAFMLLSLLYLLLSFLFLLPVFLWLFQASEETCETVGKVPRLKKTEKERT
jgi:hypothetical protein